MVRIGRLSNPVDLGADANPATLLPRSPRLRIREADVVLVTFVGTRTNDSRGSLVALAEAADAEPQLPVSVIAVGAAAPSPRHRRTPVYGLPETPRAPRACSAVTHLRQTPMGIRHS